MPDDVRALHARAQANSARFHRAGTLVSWGFTGTVMGIVLLCSLAMALLVELRPSLPGIVAVAVLAVGPLPLALGLRAVARRRVLALAADVNRAVDAAERSLVSAELPERERRDLEASLTLLRLTDDEAEALTLDAHG